MGVARTWIAGRTRRPAAAVVGGIALLTLLTLFAAWTSHTGPVIKPETGQLTLASPTFRPQGLIPINYSCAGANISPPLSWHGVAPVGTQSWAIIMQDLDVKPATWLQWSVTGISADTRSVGEGQLPTGAVTNRASNGSAGFVGACPPQGSVHHYEFTVFAMSRQVSVSASTTAQQSLQALESAAVGKVTLTGRFAR